MVASRDNSLPSNVIDTGLRMGGAPLRLLRSVVIYGANASGKSNLIKALNAFRLVVLNSATKLNDGELIPLVVPYLLNLESAQQPSTFEVVVLVADQIYRYGCSVGGAAVSREYLFIRKSIPGSRETLVFERNEPNAATTVFGASFNGDKNLIQQHTRDNCLILSRMAQDNMKQAQPLFRWFRTQLGAIDMAEQSGRYISEGLYRTAKKDIDLESMAGLVSV
ncbi:MAG: AAA family ATPase, partial [Fimbriimonadaceae bacterium]|nr:AAA family ATPase [Fimbriimonadaceae bacterium]